MKVPGKSGLWRGLFAVLAVLFSVAAFMTALCFRWEGQVNIFLNTLPPAQSVTSDTNYYASDYERSDDGYMQMVADGEQHDIRAMREGAVLVRNEDAALPLSPDERRVTLFGRAVADPVYRGNSGGPSLDPTRLVTLRGALESEGFVINETLYDAYADSPTARVKVAVENGDGVRSDIGEEDLNFYTDELRSSYATDYNDAAIVMFSRDGGEGRDLFYDDADGVSQLALHRSEADLLTMIAQSGSFGKTIVLINSAYPMELGWVDEERYGVDACLWIGGPGLTGFHGVADLLVGKADPSGHFVDTYASDSLSSAAVQNAFDISFTGGNADYIVEAEGIYVGYKYYETRYHDMVLGINGAAGAEGVFASEGNSWNYADEMAYPFGYGISYASFTQTVTSVEWDRESHTVTAIVNVRNDGYPENSAYTGESGSVVQLYVSLPYESGMAEKSAVQLIGFGKTGLLAEGESEDVTITVDDYLFATYDMDAVNGADESKTGCYVFDEGDYVFSVGSDVHDALNNVMAARYGAEVSGKLTDAFGNVVAGDESKTRTVTLDTQDNTTYAVSRETGNVVSNRFEDVDINYWYDDDVVTYMSRNDWTTFPETYDDLTATDEMIAQMEEAAYVKPSDAPSYDSFTQDAPVTVTLVEMRDVPFDDPKWTEFIDQLSVAEMGDMIGESFGQKAVTDIGKNANTNSDGPAGPQAGYDGDSIDGTATTRVNEVVAASSWNTDILAERGSFIAEDCLFGGTTQLWSPGANIHRTPFSGRNFEYYSEDSIMSYLCGAAQCAAMQAKGCNAAPKHFAGNDQETNRGGLCIYMTEQALRQGPFKGFEGAMVEGGALGTMMSCSRIGNREVYASPEVLTGLLREEWGWEGVTITDSVASWSTAEGSRLTVPCLVAGTDTFNARAACGTDVRTYLLQNRDGYILQCLREANHRFFFAMSRSNLINGMAPGMAGTDFIPWWQPALIAITAVIGVAALACLAMFVLSRYVFIGKNTGGI